MTPTHPVALDVEALRQIAEDAAMWQDEWDSHDREDGSAVDRHLNTFDPRTILSLLERVAALEAAVPDDPFRHTPLRCYSCAASTPRSHSPDCRWLAVRGGS